ncbi:MAG: hypothetical protein HZR80_18170 [Candidatus Heimdallarchaeota archaeon]
MKLQCPFDRYKKWKTLRDTQEELLSIISLQTKEGELQEIQEEIEKRKTELIQQRASFMQGELKLQSTQKEQFE